jgi:prevent-host-death family protein
MLTKTLSEVKAHLPQILTEVEDLGESVVVTRSGRPAGVILPVDEYEGLMETLEILSDSETLEGIRRGLADIEAGNVVSHEALWDELAD